MSCIFVIPNISHNISDVKLEVGRTVLNTTKSMTILGVILDDKQTFLNHRLHICRKMSKNVGILCKLRSILPGKKLSHAIQLLDTSFH